MAVFLQSLVPFFRLTPLRNEWQDVELNTPLDALYLNGDKSAFKNALKSFKKDGGLKGYRLASHESIDKVMDEIAQLDPGQISPSLYESYSENLRKAVDQVFKKDNGNGLSDQLRANVSKFAAYKAYNATIDIQREMGNDWEDAKMVLRTYNRYQTTEYNTTVSRCRTAKQFEQFNDPDNRRLFPNLRWLPSRSADPRESHKLFWDRVWSKDDSFWLENTPGSLWNCKCDWEETDDPVTDGNPKGLLSAKGLCGNPGKTGEVFTTLNSELSKKGKENGYKSHPYFTSVDIVEGEQMVSRLYYQDNKSELMISVMADPSEISDNIATGRVLAKYCTIKVAPHFTQSSGFSRKNPEFEIDGYIADGKRIHSYKGVGDAFRKAIVQDCKIVVLDLDAHNVRCDEHLSKKISARVDDFTNKGMLRCYVVKDGKCAVIDRSLFLDYPATTDKRGRDDAIFLLIKKALE